MITRRTFIAQTGLLGGGLLLGASFQDAKTLKPTEPNIEGPFFRKGAPFRTKLAEGVKGAPLKISGQVLATDGTPLKNAVVEVWHADSGGEYDEESDAFRMRGRIRTDEKGLYVYETIMPGQYDEGKSKRPAHIHYKVAAEGRKTLTTQLYFKGDPYLESDRFVRKSLIIELDKEKKSGAFDIVLAGA